MKRKPAKTIPTAVLQSGDEKFNWLQDIKSLSIGELVEIYAEDRYPLNYTHSLTNK